MALDTGDPFKLAAARDLLRHTKLEVRWGGYDRAQVDAYVAHLTSALE